MHYSYYNIFKQLNYLSLFFELVRLFIEQKTT